LTTNLKKFFLKLYHNQFCRFLFVGGINTIFGYSVFALFIFLKLHYSIASLLATILGILFNFKTTGYIVFKNKSGGCIWRFFCVYILTYFCGVGFLAVFNYFKISNYTAGAILLFPMAILTFVLQKYFVFKNITIA